MTSTDITRAAGGPPAAANDDTSAPTDAAPAVAATGTPDGTCGRRLALVLGLTAVVSLPLVVAVVALRTPRWYPLLDLAMTEMRVRDVGTEHTPLVGLVGRLSSNGNQGSHLGPISFWALAPIYRLLGSTAWSLLLGVTVLNITAIGLTIWAALRRGGAVVALGVAAGLAVLVHLYDTNVLTEPWNPYMPVMWWMLTLVSLWAVLGDDLPMLPVTVVAASFATQTHISYVGVIGGAALVLVVAGIVRLRHLRDDPGGRRRLLWWSAGAAGLAVVLWTPTIIDQVTGDPGNVSIVVDHFLGTDEEPVGFISTDEDPIGIGRAAEMLLVELNPWRLLAGQPATHGNVLPGIALVATWAAAAVVTRRLPDAAGGRSVLLRLHLVVGAALAFGFVSITRIIGFVWHYLALWVWSIAVLAIVAIVWTAVLAALAVRHRRSGAGAPTGDAATARLALRRAGIAALAAVLVAWTAWFAAGARDAEPTQANYSAILAEFSEQTTAAIDAGEVAGGGRDGRYLITWTDGINLGSTGYGLANELERDGYDAGVSWPYGPGALEHRVMDPEDATAEIHISFGPDIERWDAKPGVERLVWVDPRTDEQRADYEAARSEVLTELEQAGLDHLVPMVDASPFQLYFNDDLPADLEPVVKTINDIGQPAALYIGPPSP